MASAVPVQAGVRVESGSRVAHWQLFFPSQRTRWFEIMGLLDPLFGAEAVDKIFADRSRLQRMLDFEAALARAEARVGVIPVAVAAPIGAKCQADLFDLVAVAQASAGAGNVAIPMVKSLTALVGKDHGEAARYVHWGATSQDAIDTGLVLQLRDAVDFIEGDLNRLSEELRALSEAHRSTPVAARTWMQHAVPTVFGLKVAGWLDAVSRHRTRVRELRQRVLVVQFGGAAGTLASLGTRGVEVAAALAEELELDLPALPWHGHRDRVAEVATTLALLTGTLGKIARDLSLQMQTEVGEVREPSGAGRGGSSTMPHKRNPVTCAVVLAAADRVPGLTGVMLTAMSQEHERGLGGWHAEWETLPEIVRLSAGALHHITDAIAGLEIDTERMRQNLELSQGLIFAEAVTMMLAKHVGKQAAHEIIEASSRTAIAEKKHLRDVLLDDPGVTAHLGRGEIESRFEPLNSTGVAGQFIERAIAASKAASSESD
jgi:3-carboxy-cis,cis-muconate cycloisomerase